MSFPSDDVKDGELAWFAVEAKGRIALCGPPSEWHDGDVSAIDARRL